MSAAVPAIERALSLLKQKGTDSHGNGGLSPLDLFKKVGFDAWRAIEDRFKS